MIYSEKLKQIREEKEIKQFEISRLLNFHDKTYGQFEREERYLPIKHLNTLANYYNVSIDYIFSLTKISKYPNYKNEINIEISSKRLKEFRKENKITQVQISSFLNTVQSNIVKYEQGKNFISTPYLYAICKKYNISADYLLGKIDTPKYLN